MCNTIPSSGHFWFSTDALANICFEEQPANNSAFVRSTASVITNGKTNVAQNSHLVILKCNGAFSGRTAAPCALSLKWRQSHRGPLSLSPHFQPSGEIIYRHEQLNPPSNYSILRHRHQMHWLPLCSAASSHPARKLAAALPWHRSDCSHRDSVTGMKGGGKAQVGLVWWKLLYSNTIIFPLKTNSLAYLVQSASKI